MRHTFALRFGAVAFAAVAIASCTVHQADEGPAPFGPSDFATTIGMTVTPDTINQDGASQASIVVSASSTNPNDRVVTVRLETAVDGVVRDFGTLRARTLSISLGADGSGSASTSYTAPASSPFAGGAGTVVTVLATPITSNAQASVTRSAEIRLVPPGVILPPAGTPTATFTVTPTPIVVGVGALFDGSQSLPGSGAAQINSYSWNFGDGSGASGSAVNHTFSASGTYLVTLTVTNDRGVAASTTQSISAAAAAKPTAVFTVSPSNLTTADTAFFNASSSSAGVGRTIVSYAWDFGDSVTATGVSAQHKYSAVNTYVVTLTVTDDLGQKGSSTQSVAIK